MMVDAFKTNINDLLSRGFKPYLNIMDNVASKAINDYLGKEYIKL